MQVVVDGVSLDNGSSRYCHGEIADSVSPDGIRTITVPFAIEGDTAAAVHTLAAQTVADFVKRNVTVTVKLDADAGNNYASVAPSDGTHLNVVTSLVDDPDHEKTAFSMAYLLVIVAELVNPLPVGEITGVTEEGLDYFEVSLRYNAGRIVSRVVSGSFVDTGATDAEDHYAAARESILTNHLKCAADGSRHATNKFVLVGEVCENFDGAKRRFDFLLESVYQERALANTAAARGGSWTITTSEPEEWDEAGGPRPTLIEARGEVFLSADVLVGGAIRTVWETGLRADVLAAINADTGKSATRRVREAVTVDPARSALQFDCLYQADQPTVFAFSRTYEGTNAVDQAIAAQSNGKHYVQESPTSPDQSWAITTTRVGIGLADLSASPPVNADGRIPWYSDSHYQQSGPLRVGDASGVFHQTLTQRFLMLAVEQSEPPAPPEYTRSGF